MAGYTLGIHCSHAVHYTLVIGDNTTFWRRDQSGDLAFFISNCWDRGTHRTSAQVQTKPGLYLHH